MPLLPSFITPAAGTYLVGGCVRDLLLGRPPKDFDVAVAGSPAEYAAALAAALNGRVVELGRTAARTWRVATAGRIVDVSPIQGAGIRDDLLRRDFTINAMAIATDSGEVIDVVDGLGDLETRTVRMVSPSAFSDDPVRLVRAFRFAAQLGFTVESGTRGAVRGAARLILRSAGERIRDELYHLMSAENPVPAVTGMAETGLLTAIFPELQSRPPAIALRGVDALCRMDALCAGAHPDETFRGLIQGMSPRRRVLLRLGLVLHPLGLPRGTDEREAVLDRLRFPNRDRDHLVRLLTLQQLPMRLYETTPAPTARDEVLFFLAADEAVPDLLLLAAAWAQSGRVAAREHPSAFDSYAGRLLHRYREVYCPRKAMPAPLTGDDLMAEFGLRPSPLIGELLQEVEAERLARGAFSREDAQQFVQRTLEKKGSLPRSGREPRSPDSEDATS
jgi:tRNA nucleotidyltransferase/poly(A) polymerase